MSFEISILVSTSYCLRPRSTRRVSILRTSELVFNQSLQHVYHIADHGSIAKHLTISATMDLSHDCHHPLADTTF